MNYILKSLLDVKITLFIKDSTSDLNKLTNNWPLGKQIVWENYYIPVYIHQWNEAKKTIEIFFHDDFNFYDYKKWHD